MTAKRYFSTLCILGIIWTFTNLQGLDLPFYWLEKDQEATKQSDEDFNLAIPMVPDIEELKENDTVTKNDTKTAAAETKEEQKDNAFIDKTRTAKSGQDKRAANPKTAAAKVTPAKKQAEKKIAKKVEKANKDIAQNDEQSITTRQATQKSRVVAMESRRLKEEAMLLKENAFFSKQIRAEKKQVQNKKKLTASAAKKAIVPEKTQVKDLAQTQELLPPEQIQLDFRPEEIIEEMSEEMALLNEQPNYDAQAQESEQILEQSKELLLDSDMLLVETEKLLNSPEKSKTKVTQETTNTPAQKTKNNKTASLSEAASQSKQAQNTATKTTKNHQTAALKTSPSPHAQQEPAIGDTQSFLEQTSTKEAESIYDSPLFLETQWPGYSVKKSEKEEVSKEIEGLTKVVIVEDKSKTPVLTSSLQDRKTLKIRLENGLEAYIISDPQSNQSAAALSVQSGSWQDPEEFPGMAHFVEHMLFLGTESFPDESGFQSYVQDHNGFTNAYTSGDHSSYAFSISHDAFKSTLERFASFFISPLFDESGLERELQAIDQEFAKSIENDNVRELFVMKELGNKYHPASKFNYGNIKTLKGVRPQDLKEWFNKHYSSNLMHLVINTSLPIEEAQKLVAAYFSGIKNSEAQIVSPQTTLSSPTYDANIVYITPLKDIRKLTLTWELSSEFANDLDNKTMHIIGHVLGHEGNESLLADLKRDSLAESLASGGQSIGPNNALFQIEVQLTSKGLENVDKVIEKCFQAVNQFKNSGIPPYIFDELKKMALTEYQYQSRQDPYREVVSHARMLTKEPLSSYPEKSSLFTSFNPRKIRRMLAELSPDHCHLSISAFPELSKVKADRMEKWMGVQYAVVPVPERKIATWYKLQPNPEINIPKPNRFIPENLRLVNRPGNGLQPHPISIFDEEMGKIYFSADTEYLVPEISWNLRVVTPSLDHKSENAVLADLFIKAVQEKLTPTSYQASLAGLHSRLNHGDKGIEISLNGYSEKASVLLEEIIKTLRHVKINQAEFELYKQSMQRKYENFSKESPLSQSRQVLESVIFENYSTSKEKAAAVVDVSYEDFQKFQASLFDKVYLEGILYGNITASEGRKVLNQIQNLLATTPYNKESQENTKSLILPLSVGPFYIVDKTDRQGNAVLLMLQNGNFSWKNRAAQQILSTGLKEPFFTMLRTKQQTGYLVGNWDQDIEGKLYSFFAVQSNTHNVRDLLARFELFFESFLQEFSAKEFTKERFEQLKKVLVEDLEQPFENLAQKGNFLKKVIFDHKADFDWLSKRIHGFEELTYSEFLNFSNAYLGRKNKQRLAILMKGSLPEDKSFYYYRVDNTKKMRTISDYSSAEEIR